MPAVVTPEDVLLAYGPLGVMVLAGGWFSWYMIKRLLREIDELRKQRDEMVRTLMEVVPLMKRSTEIHEMRQRADELTRQQLIDNMAVLKDVQRDLERMR